MKNDDARFSLTGTDPPRRAGTRLPRSSSNPSLKEEIFDDDASIEKQNIDDIQSPRLGSPDATLSTHDDALQSPANDPDLVTWDGPNDPENPLTWSVRRRWTITVANTLMTLCVYAAEVLS
jgi:hypothetical protein